MNVRPATEADIPALLPLMRALAEYEHYIDSFAVTEEVLREQGFSKRPPDFHCLVSEDASGALVGMLVYYLLPFTAQAKPTLFIKELFVAPEARGRRVGEALMRAAARAALAHGCAQVKWQVAEWNRDGRRFYERLGARANPVWIEYALPPEAVDALAQGEPSDAAPRPTSA